MMADRITGIEKTLVFALTQHAIIIGLPALRTHAVHRQVRKPVGLLPEVATPLTTTYRDSPAVCSSAARNAVYVTTR